MPDKIKWSSLDPDGDGKAHYQIFWDVIIQRIAHCNKDAGYNIEPEEVAVFNTLGLPALDKVISTYYPWTTPRTYNIETYIKNLYKLSAGRVPVKEELTGLTIQRDIPIEKEKARAILAKAGINFIDFDN